MTSSIWNLFEKIIFPPPGILLMIACWKLVHTSPEACEAVWMVFKILTFPPKPSSMNVLYPAFSRFRFCPDSLAPMPKREATLISDRGSNRCLVRIPVRLHSQFLLWFPQIWCIVGHRESLQHSLRMCVSVSSLVGRLVVSGLWLFCIWNPRYLTTQCCQNDLNGPPLWS